MTGPAGSGHGVFKMSRVGSCRVVSGRVESSRVGKCSKSHESGRVGSGQVGVQNLKGRVEYRGFQISWVRPGRVKSSSNLTGRVGSRFFKPNGSGQAGSRGDEKLIGRVRS